MRLKLRLSIFSALLFSTYTLQAVDISGTIKYERINPLHIGVSTGLNFSDITQETAKQITVEVIDSAGSTIASTVTDDIGAYTFLGLTPNIDVKIRAYARLLKASSWDVAVVDNSNGDSLYAIEGSLASTGSVNSNRNLLATASTKSSPPFAILDNVYSAMQKILSASASVPFPSLRVGWSINNIETGSYYQNGRIVLQGDQSGDSDEYDTHVIIHEWGHYFEDKFSRSGIGGPHGAGNRLDIRVAFGEGFGNAFSAIVTDDPIYFDTTQTNGWNMNIESEVQDTPGWFSEASVQRILYDVYDVNNDGADTLALGFTPIYELFVNQQKNTKAFTSLFSFVTELKNNNPADTAKIDNIVSSEGIATIADIYGTNRISNVEAIALPVYNDLIVNETLTNICTSTSYGGINKLNNYKYLKFTIATTQDYPIRVIQSNGTNSDPDFKLYKASPFQYIGGANSGTLRIETSTVTLAAGEYLMELSDARSSGTACFYVSVGDVTIVAPGIVDSTSESQSVGVELPSNPLLLLILLLGMMSIPVIFLKQELSK